MYINNVQVATQSTTIAPIYDTSPLNVGIDLNNSNIWNGIIDNQLILNDVKDYS